MISCFDNKYTEDELTIGNLYDYKEIDASCIEILNDKGEKKAYIKSRFIQPQELWKIGMCI
jgi:hypothetical protein